MKDHSYHAICRRELMKGLTLTTTSKITEFMIPHCMKGMVLWHIESRKLTCFQSIMEKLQALPDDSGYEDYGAIVKFTILEAGNLKDYLDSSLDLDAERKIALGLFDENGVLFD